MCESGGWVQLEMVGKCWDMKGKKVDRDLFESDRAIMAMSLVFNAIAPEALQNGNYSNWSLCVQNYLLGQDLWDIVETGRSKENAPTENLWKKKNAMALHAIQISCGPDILDKIRRITIAKDAWDTLAKMHRAQTQRVIELGSSSGTVNNDNDDYDKYSALLGELDKNDDWYSVKAYLNMTYASESNLLEAKLSSNGYTILHFAVVKGYVKMVKDMMPSMAKKVLEVQDKNGRTALCCAIAYGIDELVYCMVEKDRGLLSIADNTGDLPVVFACVCGNKDLARYLYTRTPLRDLTLKDGANGAALLGYCFTSKMIDILCIYSKSAPVWLLLQTSTGPLSWP